MNRRDFLKSIGAAAALCTVPPSALTAIAGQVTEPKAAGTTLRSLSGVVFQAVDPDNIWQTICGISSIDVGADYIDTFPSRGFMVSNPQAVSRIQMDIKGPADPENVRTMLDMIAGPSVVRCRIASDEFTYKFTGELIGTDMITELDSDMIEAAISLVPTEWTIENTMKFQPE